MCSSDLTQRTDLWLPRGRTGWGGIEWEVGISRCKLLYIEWINNKVLLYSTGNYIQYPVINHNGKEYGECEPCGGVTVGTELVALGLVRSCGWE